MIEVLAFNGSPRKKGNTEVLLNAVTRGVEKAGGRIDIIRLCDLSISPCIGCGGCSKKGKCVIDDDMTKLYDQIGSAKRIILASPIYFYGITSQAKAFVDRIQALWSRKYLLGKGVGRDQPDRKGYLVSVAATEGERVFEGAELTASYFFDAVDAEYSGALLVRGMDKRGEVSKVAKELERAEKFGKGVVSG
jgi:multimeric flavodoxin WrbA